MTALNYSEQSFNTKRNLLIEKQLKQNQLRHSQFKNAAALTSKAQHYKLIPNALNKTVDNILPFKVTSFKQPAQSNNLYHQYLNICQQHQQDKRWIIMIDPQESCITKLSKTKQINTTNILRVHTKNTQLNFTNIAKTLTKGNCAAIVVCDAQFDKQQLNTLKACAKQGNSQCVLLKTNTELH